MITVGDLQEILKGHKSSDLVILEMDCSFHPLGVAQSDCVYVYINNEVFDLSLTADDYEMTSEEWLEVEKSQPCIVLSAEGMF